MEEGKEWINVKLDSIVCRLVSFTDGCIVAWIDQRKPVAAEMRRTSIKPKLTDFYNRIHTYCLKSRIYCHICGNIKPVVHDLVETGLDCITPLDPLGKFSVSEIRHMVGNDFMFMGGVDTLSFVNKNPETVRLEAECCIREGFVNHRNFAIGSGCVVPRTAKIETLQALTEASKNVI